MQTLSGLKITVGITAYNRPEFLREAVRSVLHQSFESFELIISNDYPEVAVTLDCLGIKDDSRVKIVNQDSNLGEVKNMNYLLDVAQGEWFVWLADDDLLHPEFLMRASKAILSNQDSSIVGFFSNYIAASCPDGVFPTTLGLNQCVRYDAARFLVEYTSRKIPLIGCYGVMRVDSLRKIGGMPSLGSSFGPYSDTLIPILLAEHGELCWVDEPLVFLRTHADSLSCKSAEFAAFTSAEADFLRNLKRICDSKAGNLRTDEVVANMVRWFSINEWVVLCRASSLSKYVAAMRFIEYQVITNLPRLSLGYWPHHISVVLRILGMQLAIWVYARLRTALKRNQSAFLRSMPR
ncbi:MAG: GalNAc(5)-diNAcBac-PP-undecaprenol beta-1,3-glucosyltransferase [Nitrosomonadaceae bacterium]|nr:GalNAc(5)-diNAcBac-PP-undecaprenol beta-1,3-glucosyltransferase [Nitrosomonadaceae bacterium]